MGEASENDDDDEVEKDASAGSMVTCGLPATTDCVRANVPAAAVGATDAVRASAVRGGDCEDDAATEDVRVSDADAADDEDVDEDADEDEDDKDEDEDEVEVVVIVSAAGATGRATDAPAKRRGNRRSKRRCVSAAECCSVRT